MQYFAYEIFSCTRCSFCAIFYCSSQLLRTEKIMSTSFPSPSVSPFSFSYRDQRTDQAARKCEACHAQHGAAVKFTGSEKSCQEEQCRQDDPCDQANQQSFSSLLQAGRAARCDSGKKTDAGACVSHGGKFCTVRCVQDGSAAKKSQAAKAPDSDCPNQKE